MASIPPTAQPITHYVFHGEFEVRGENPSRQELLLTTFPNMGTVVYMCHLDRKVSVLAHLDYYTSVTSTFNEIQRVLEKEQSGLRFSPGFKAIVFDRGDSVQRQRIIATLEPHKVVVYGRQLKSKQPEETIPPDYNDPTKFVEIIRTYQPVNIQLSADTKECGDVRFLKNDDIDHCFEYVQRRETECWETPRFQNLSNFHSYIAQRCSRTSETIPKFDGRKPYMKLFEDELFNRLKITYRLIREKEYSSVSKTPSLTMEQPAPPSSSYPPKP